MMYAADCFEMLLNNQDIKRHHVSGDDDVHKYRLVTQVHGRLFWTCYNLEKCVIISHYFSKQMNIYYYYILYVLRIGRN